MTDKPHAFPEPWIEQRLDVVAKIWEERTDQQKALELALESSRHFS